MISGKIKMNSFNLDKLSLLLFLGLLSFPRFLLSADKKVTKLTFKATTFEFYLSFRIYLFLGCGWNSSLLAKSRLNARESCYIRNSFKGGEYS